MKKKVAILTHELGNNYGGIMQAYALQKYVTQFDANVVTSGFHSPKRLVYAKEWIKARLGRPVSTERYRQKYTQQFVHKYIRQVDPQLLFPGEFSEQYDAVVVGSDQVWRQAYVPVGRYLLDFAENQNVTRISYAASFGTDDLSEYDQSLIKTTRRLAQKFDAISVRESSAVDLVKEHWGLSAEQHVDPALLFEAREYEDLVKKSDEIVTSSKGQVFTYLLDPNECKEQIASRVSQLLKMDLFDILPPTLATTNQIFANPERYQLPPVEQWLKSFIDAEFVITDSFHGMAFAIIFNKPFIAIANQKRGLTRFASLLRVFELEDRLISNVTDVTDELVSCKLNWGRVNDISRDEQVRSQTYLAKHLLAQEK